MTGSDEDEKRLREYERMERVFARIAATPWSTYLAQLWAGYWAPVTLLSITVMAMLLAGAFAQDLVVHFAASASVPALLICVVRMLMHMHAKIVADGDLAKVRAQLEKARAFTGRSDDGDAVDAD